MMETLKPVLATLPRLLARALPAAKAMRLALPLLMAFALAPGEAAEAALRLEGSLPSGAAFVFDVPAQWNGTLLLFSHGYARGPDNPARNHSRGEKEWLLSQGYALAGSSYARTGWALEEAVPDQLAALDAFAAQVGKPARTIAWGTSMGGLVTIALLERHPMRFDGGLALCASASGTVGMMNAALDGAFAFRTLAGPQALPVLLDGGKERMREEVGAWRRALEQAQGTPAGRARIALAATLAQVPADAGLASIAQQEQLYRGFADATLLPRDDQHARAGANFSWNTGIDYAGQLAKSGRMEFVRTLYREAGADLDADLAVLAAAPRIAASAPAVAYMKRNYAPSGVLAKPLLLMQSVSDPVTLVELSGDYARQARRADSGSLVREAYVQRPGHCNFTVGETVAALQAVERSAVAGAWGGGETEAATLNALAAKLVPQIPGSAAVAAPPVSTFVDYTPAPFLRSCAGGKALCEGEEGK